MVTDSSNLAWVDELEESPEVIRVASRLGVLVINFPVVIFPPFLSLFEIQNQICYTQLSLQPASVDSDYTEIHNREEKWEGKW